MSLQPFPSKDPDSTIRYWFDFSAWLDVEDGGDVVLLEVAIDDPPDASLVIGDTATEDGVILFWLSGGTLDATYTVRARITLTDGTIEDASRTITIEQH